MQSVFLLNMQLAANTFFGEPAWARDVTCTAACVTLLSILIAGGVKLAKSQARVAVSDRYCTGQPVEIELHMGTICAQERG
jgi:hypothetical protein